VPNQAFAATPCAPAVHAIDALIARVCKYRAAVTTTPARWAETSWRGTQTVHDVTHTGVSGATPHAPFENQRTPLVCCRWSN
jgi:hypothetical protein